MRTIINNVGKTIFFSYDDFINKIVKGNCCFICGVSPESEDFNNEHVIPNWILSRYGLHDKFIYLPNGTKYKYGQYTIPCCTKCNSELGEKIEIPISLLLKKNYTEIIQEISLNPEIHKLLFQWLSLIFFKTHLKDNLLLMNMDKRVDEGKIGDNHYWEAMHHIHCIIRSIHTNATISPNVFGTFLFFQVTMDSSTDAFDYIDTPYGRVVMVQIGELCLILVIDDSCFSKVIFSEELKKIQGRVNRYQIREIIANLNYINLNIQDRPLFKSLIKDNGNGNYLIYAELPRICKLVEKEKRFGDISSLFYHYMTLLVEANEENNKTLNLIKEGKYGFLFNENGDFLSN